MLAIRGIWKFSDADALRDVQRILEDENRFLHAVPIHYFLVTLAPFDDRSDDNDGSGFLHAYMLFLSHEDTMDAERLQLMAHEMFHHWNPSGMGKRGADEAAQWFAEGFTVCEPANPPSPFLDFGSFACTKGRRLREIQEVRISFPR